MSDSREMAEPEMHAFARMITVQVKIKRRIPGGRVVTGSGTGFVVSADGHQSLVITNRHVIDNIIEEESEVFYLTTGESSPFRIVAVRPRGADLAVLVTSMEFLQVPNLSMRRHRERMEPLYNFSYPMSQENWETGVFMTRTRYREDFKIEDPSEYETNSEYMDMCFIFNRPGSSGSAVLDKFGEVVGVVTCGVSHFATPLLTTPVEDIIELLQEFGLGFNGFPSDTNFSAARRRPRTSLLVDPDILSRSVRPPSERRAIGQSFRPRGPRRSPIDIIDEYGESPPRRRGSFASYRPRHRPRSSPEDDGDERGYIPGQRPRIQVTERTWRPLN